MKTPVPAIPVHTETMAQALEAIQNHYEGRGYAFTDLEDWNNRWAFCGGISYETYKSYSTQVQSAKRKKPQYLHVTLYRMHTGRYEIVAYIG